MLKIIGINCVFLLFFHHLMANNCPNPQKTTLHQSSIAKNPNFNSQASKLNWWQKLLVKKINKKILKQNTKKQPLKSKEWEKAAPFILITILLLIGSIILITSATGFWLVLGWIFGVILGLALLLLLFVGMMKPWYGKN